MRVKILIVAGFLLSFSIGFMVGQILLIRTQKPNELVKRVIDRSLDKYTIENLKNIKTDGASFSMVKELKDFPNFTSSEFSMSFNPNLDERTMKKTSGLINIPKGTGKYPLVVMFRGYVPSDQYFVGNGTINASYFFAKNGFITMSTDFLGYGDSDTESDNVFEARFQTYTAAINLLSLAKDVSQWNRKDVFVWAHSNGGQIALTALEATGVTYPTVLWAPVSSSFPYSILYYSNETEDTGKFLRRELSRFEDIYNTDLYSVTKYTDRIKAKIQLNQGTLDDAVPVSWSDTLDKSLKSQGIKVNYNIYPGADHQMNPVWNEVIQKDLDFFKENISEVKTIN